MDLLWRMGSWSTHNHDAPLALTFHVESAVLLSQARKQIDSPRPAMLESRYSWGGGGMAYASVLKTDGREVLWVQPPPALFYNIPPADAGPYRISPWLNIEDPAGALSGG